jgi:Tfp pilus assembly protein PilW
MPLQPRAILIEDEGPSPADRPRKRRGATMMEYLMMISLIVTVCLVGIGYFGSKTNELATSASQSINKSLNKGS